MPNAYPMCRLSDMWTNLVTTFLYIGLAIYCECNGGEVPVGMLLGTLIFCCLELCMHTVFGTIMYFRFKDKGKKTIYGPGSITAYFGFLPLGVISVFGIYGAEVTGLDWGIAAGILAFILFIAILIPETIIKRKDSPYSFKDEGYYARFLK